MKKVLLLMTILIGAIGLSAPAQQKVGQDAKTQTKTTMRQNASAKKDKTQKIVEAKKRKAERNNAGSGFIAKKAINKTR